MTMQTPGGSGVPWPPFAADMLPFGPRFSTSEMRTVEQWRMAEARLYPLITADPDLFQAAVMMVAETLDLLRLQCDTVEDLYELDVRSVVGRSQTARRVIELGFNPVVAVNAARARRWLELTEMPQLALRRGFIPEVGR